jgi:hypothetical protein
MRATALGENSGVAVRYYPQGGGNWRMIDVIKE